MFALWEQPVLDRLIASKNRDGSWGYLPEAATAAEPTALACLALAKHGLESRHWLPGLNLLAQTQRPDGGVPVTSADKTPCWATGLAVLAWTMADGDTTARFGAEIELAASWLLATHGNRLALQPDVFGHDTRLQGWPWVNGTHSWLEPTAYAVLALRAVGLGDHPRTREGIRLILDRSMPDGGWNYGNTRVLASALRPFPATTGIALAALSGQPSNTQIEAGVVYLQQKLSRIRAPVTLGWGLVGLTACGARPTDANDWLARAAKRAAEDQCNVVEYAMILLADLDRCPLTAASSDELAEAHDG